MEAVRTRWSEEIAAKARLVRDEPMPDASSIWKHIYAEDR
jgi:2-oxoisovalerate dehydrogenase E1 component alpha subunit